MSANPLVSIPSIASGNVTDGSHANVTQTATPFFLGSVPVYLQQHQQPVQQQQMLFAQQKAIQLQPIQQQQYLPIPEQFVQRQQASIGVHQLPPLMQYLNLQGDGDAMSTSANLARIHSVTTAMTTPARSHQTEDTDVEMPLAMTQNSSLHSKHADSKAVKIKSVKKLREELQALNLRLAQLILQRTPTAERAQTLFYELMAQAKAKCNRVVSLCAGYHLEHPDEPEFWSPEIRAQRAQIQANAQEAVEAKESIRAVVPKNLPKLILHTMLAENHGHHAEEVYPSSVLWARDFESSIKACNLEVENNWERLLYIALNHVQRDMLFKHLQDAHPSIKPTWSQAKAGISQLFDTATQKYYLRRQVLLCKQGEDESLEEYVLRFQTRMLACEYESTNLVVFDLFLENMQEESRLETEKWLMREYNYNWPIDIDAVAPHIIALSNPRGKKRAPPSFSSSSHRRHHRSYHWRSHGHDSSRVQEQGSVWKHNTFSDTGKKKNKNSNNSGGKWRTGNTCNKTSSKASKHNARRGYFSRKAAKSAKDGQARQLKEAQRGKPFSCINHCN